uniref:Uncharacterized protein n=1 Tax=Pararge aegeria TaxID=116150 RepID=S4NU66_9NEOP
MSGRLPKKVPKKTKYCDIGYLFGIYIEQHKMYCIYSVPKTLIIIFVSYNTLPNNIISSIHLKQFNSILFDLRVNTLFGAWLIGFWQIFPDT